MSPSHDYHRQHVAPLLADSVLGACRHEDLARLLPHVVLRELAPGEVLWASRAAADAIWLVVSGCVTLTGANGIQNEYQSGLCGEECLLGWSEREDGAVAKSSVVALRLPRAAMAKLCKQDSALRERLQQLRLARIHRATDAEPGGKGDRPVSVAVESGNPEASALTAAKASPAIFSREAMGWFCAIAVPALVLCNGSHLGLTPDAVIFLAILAATVVMWVFALVDEYVPGLFAITATLALGLATPEQVLAGFASDGFFLALSVLGLGAVISASGLSFRFLLWLLCRLPDRPRWRNAGLMLTGFFMTPLVPSINGRVALLAPLLQDMADVLRIAPGDRAATRLALAGFSGVSLFSAVFLTSKSVNFVVYGLLDAQVQAEFQWLYWTLAAAAFALCLLASYLVLAAMLTRDASPGLAPAGAPPAHVRAQIEAQMGLLGNLRSREWAALSGVVVFVFGVATASLHRIHPSWIALGILFSLLVFGVLRKNEFREKIDWPFLVYLGGLVGLTSTLNAVGLDVWLGEHLAWLGHFMRDSFATFLLLLTLVLGLIRLVVPISATVVIAATVFMPLASTYGVHPWVVGFAVLVIGEMWFMPYQCSYYLQFRELAARMGYEESAMLRVNAALNVCRLAALYASLPWWRQLGLL